MNIFSKQMLMGGRSVKEFEPKVVCSNSTVWYISPNGDLYGCGYNGYGQQGSGNTTNVTLFTKRASNVVDVACSQNTTWYIDSNGDLYGCGEGMYGKQGNNSHNNVTTFTKRASNVVKCIANNYTTVYLTTDGDLYGAGYNADGQLGQGTTNFILNFIKLASDVKDFVCSSSSTWYINTNNELYGCGGNISGEQSTGGQGSGNEVRTFTKRANAVKKVVCSQMTTWYIDTSNFLYGCGYNYYGQQGNRQSGASTNVVYFTSRSTSVSDVITCYDKTWYVKNENAYRCGRNNYGQLGMSDTNDRSAFIQFSTYNIKDISACGYMTWLLTTDGDLYGCGYNSSGQQGSGDTTNVLTFTKRASNILKLIDYSVDLEYGNTSWYIDSNGDLYGCGEGGLQGNGSTNNQLTFENKMQYMN